MPASVDRAHQKSSMYRVRMLLSTVLAQLILIGLVHWWPSFSRSSPDTAIYDTRGQELIAIEEIQPTRQAQKPPPPPPPLIPVEVQDDLIIEEEIEISDQFLTLDEYADELFEQQQLSGNVGKSSKAPEVGPKPLRFVEPEYTRAARRKRVRAEVIVEVLVDEKGLVRNAKIVERFLYNGSGEEKELVSSLRYGLEESALAAAQRWMFQPARQNGQPVQSYTTLTFSFGV